MQTAPRTGVLLLNLGTPDSPAVRDVRRYLREFLSDPLVLDMPAPARWALLNLVILPFRPQRSAEAYAKIWTDAGSPLLTNGLALRDALSLELGEPYVVALGMRYGSPAIAAALARLREADVARILVLPMFPQYSSAATGSAVQRVEEELDRHPTTPPVEVLPPFYAEPRFVAAWARVARPTLAAFAPDFVLLSYHGLPERHVQATDSTGAHCLGSDSCCDAIVGANRDCYRAHCYATSRALASTLELEPGSHGTSFQSRLGRTPWIRPYTDEELPRLAAAGHRRLAVMCPAFVADCLETLEEIGIRARQQWLELGGEELALVPSLNATAPWVSTIAQWVREHA